LTSAAGGVIVAPGGAGAARALDPSERKRPVNEIKKIVLEPEASGRLAQRGL